MKKNVLAELAKMKGKWLLDQGTGKGSAARMEARALNARKREEREGLGRGLFAASGMRGGSVAVELFLKEGANPDFRAKYRATPMMEAARMGAVDSMALLHEAGADASLRDGTGLGVVEHAFIGGSEKALEFAVGVISTTDAGRSNALELLRAMALASSTYNKNMSFKRGGWNTNPPAADWDHHFKPRTVSWLFDKGRFAAADGVKWLPALFVGMSSCLGEGAYEEARVLLEAAESVFPGIAETSKVANELVVETIRRDDPNGLVWLLDNGFLGKGKYELEVYDEHENKGMSLPLVWACAWFGSGGCLELVSRIPSLAREAHGSVAGENAVVIHMTTGLAGAKALTEMGADFTVMKNEVRHNGKGGSAKAEVNWLESVFYSGEPTKEMLEWIAKTHPKLVGMGSFGFSSAFESYARQGDWAREKADRWLSVMERAGMSKGMGRLAPKRGARVNSSI